MSDDKAPRIATCEQCGQKCEVAFIFGGAFCEECLAEMEDEGLEGW